MDVEKGRSYITLLNALPIKILEISYDMTFLLETVYSTGLTTYDAAYLILAIEHHLPIATLDVALQKAAQKADVPLYLG